MTSKKELKTNTEETKIEVKSKGPGFFSFISKYYKQFPYFLVGMIVCIVFNVFFSVIQPQLLNHLIKDVTTNKPTWWVWVVIMFVALSLTAVFTFLTSWIGGKLGKKVEIEVRQDTLNNLIKQDMSFYSNRKSGETLTKIISDTTVIGDQSTQVPSSIIQAALTLTGASIVLFTIDVKLALVAVIFTALILVAVALSFGTIRMKMLKVRKVMTTVNGDISDKLGAVSLIKSTGNEASERKYFKKIHVKYYQANNKANSAMATIRTVMTVGITSISVVVIAAAAILYHNDTSKLVIVLPSFLVGIRLMISPIIRLSMLTSGLAQASAASTRLDELIATESKIDLLNDDNKLHLDELSGDIVLKDVVFAYPEKPDAIILPKTTFTFKEGKSYAFVGETGVGKSTISKLLLRFYDPKEGEILINENVNLQDVYMPSYLSRVGYVEQEPVILFGNIIDNVSYGVVDATKEKVIEACKKAKLDEIIMTWKDGYETILGERGMSLSGGQKQRLVIARMFLKDPSLLILDEATSALDNIVEAEINEELKNLSKGRTTITIAHRLSTIKDVDQIIVLKKDEGIVEVGSFDELRNKKGYFQDLYNAGLME